MRVLNQWRRGAVEVLMSLASASAAFAVLMATGSTPAQAPDPPPIPKACTTKADCTKSCPPDAKGCDCRQNERGDSRCTPTCQADADCPNGRGGRGECKAGFCAPPRGAQGHQGPRTCKVAAECTGACPPDAKGCTCHATRDGESKCAPTCQVDADCPRGGEAQTCKEGICRRPRPPDAKEK